MDAGMTIFGLLFFFQILIFLFGFVLFIVALIDVIRSEFEGNDKLLWALLIVLLPVLGPLLYFIIGRSKRINR